MSSHEAGEHHESNGHAESHDSGHEVLTTGKKDVAHRRHHAQMGRELRAWNSLGHTAKANFRHINH